MMIQFVFDIQKTIAAVVFLLEKQGGELDMFLALKMLYLADKEALIQWGKPITGDSFVSMPKGPVLSEVYDLFKGTAPSDDQDLWNEYFSELVSHAIHLLKPAETGLLSEREMEVLEEARCKINERAPWAVARWLHETCPEWQDPHGGSEPINPETILRNAGLSEERICEIKRSNDVFRRLRSLLSQPPG